MNNKLKNYLMKLIFLFLTVFSGHSYALGTCANIQSGTVFGNAAFYSDCTVTTEFNPTTDYWLVMFASDQNIQISLNGFPSPSDYVPPPVGVFRVGTFDGLNLKIVDMGSTYNGDCSEIPVSGVYNMVEAVGGNYYCGIVYTSGGSRIYLQGKWTGSEFVGYKITHAAPVAIPTLGEWAMIFMASLMAMFGIRRMRRSK